MLDEKGDEKIDDVDCDLKVNSTNLFNVGGLLVAVSKLEEVFLKLGGDTVLV
jgi:hypothetical protein